MSTLIGSVLNTELPRNKYRILTISSNDYIFDNYFELLDPNKIEANIWTLNTLSYDPKLLPNINVIDNGVMPVDKEFDLIISHTRIGHEVARRISNLFHIPLLCWKHEESPLFPAFMSVSSFDGLHLMKVGAVCGTVPYDPIVGKYFLCRKEYFEDLKNLFGDIFEILPAKHKERQLKYGEAKGLVSMRRDHCLEIDECQMVGIPVLSHPNKYHSNIEVFKNTEELSILINGIEELKKEQSQLLNMPEAFQQELLYILGLTKGYNHAVV